MRQAFLELARPFVCALVMENTMDDTIATMRNADFAGAQAIGVHMRMMPAEDKTLEKMQAMVRCTMRPVMALHYRAGADPTLTDDDRAELLLRAARAGASIVDVMGDFYDPSPMEITKNEAAISRQMRLIDQIHELGSKVIMSSHLSVSRNTEQVLEHLQSFEKRGVDVVKIVPQVNTEEEMLEAVKTTMVLRRELKTPFVHVTSGRYGRHQRTIGPMFGSLLSFGHFPPHASGEYMPQAPVETLRAIVTNVYEHMDTDIC